MNKFVIILQMLSQEKSKKLKDKAPELIQKTMPTEELWTSLIHNGAVSKVDALNMKVWFYFRLFSFYPS